MQINNLRQENELIDIFCSLAAIPSPSLHEEKVIEWIQNFCKENNINCQLDEYKNGYTISRIDGRDNTVEFLNGIKIKSGSLIGEVNEDAIRRLQIRETILFTKPVSFSRSAMELKIP